MKQTLFMTGQQRSAGHSKGVQRFPTPDKAWRKCARCMRFMSSMLHPGAFFLQVARSAGTSEAF